MSKKRLNQNKPKAPEQKTFTQDGATLTLDAFVNMMARMGAGSGNLAEGAEYPLTRLTKNFMLMTSLYRSHWITRKIIDVIPEDMLKNWIQLTGTLEPGQEKAFNKVVRKTRTISKLSEAMKWARLYGGAVALVMIKGQGDEESLKEPLDLDTIETNSYKGLMVLDRWSGVSPESELVSDISDPEFGLPNMYRVNLAGGKSLLVHHSRLIRFIGRDLPLWEKQNEQYWGASEIEHIFDEIKKRDNASGNISSLIFLANLRVLKMGDLGQMLGSGNQQAQKRVYDTITAQTQLMNNNGMYVIDKEDDFDTKQYSFGGLSEIYELFMMDIAGAAEIPVTKLFGRSAAGMNATGEGDAQNYYEMIHDKQENELRPVLDKLIPIIMASEFGAIPDDYDFEFYPNDSSSDNDKADLGGKRTTAITEVFNAGLIGRKTALKELKQMEDATGMWSNITDEMVDAADDELIQPDMEPDEDLIDEDEPDDEQSEKLETVPKDRGVLQERTKQASKQDASTGKLK